MTERVALVTGASRGIGRAVALQLARAGHRLALNARSEPVLHACAIETDMLQPTLEAGHADLLRRTIPLGRWGQPAEVAAVVAFPASDAAAYAVGAAVPVTGGCGI